MTQVLNHQRLEQIRDRQKEREGACDSADSAEAANHRTDGKKIDKTLRKEVRKEHTVRDAQECKKP